MQLVAVPANHRIEGIRVVTVVAEDLKAAILYFDVDAYVVRTCLLIFVVAVPLINLFIYLPRYSTHSTLLLS